MTILLADSFDTIPAEPKYVIQKPDGARPFTLFDEGEGVRFRHVAQSGAPRVEISPRDPASKVEIGIRIPQNVVHECGYLFRVPEVQPLRDNKTVVMQFWQRSNRNPPLSLEIVRDEYRLVRLWGDASTGNPNRQVLWRKNTLRGVWQSLTLRVKFCGAAPTGFIDWVWNGVQYWFPGPNCYIGTEGLLPKIGIYRATAPAGEVTRMDFGHWRIERV